MPTPYVSADGTAQGAPESDDGKDGGRIALLLATDLVYVGVFFFLFTEIGCASIRLLLSPLYGLVAAMCAV